MGYEFRHMLKLTFMSDNELLGRALSALAKCPVDPEINLSYTISDKEGAKNLLLANAVKDAMAKASLLTEAAGVALGEIVSIDYSWGEAALEVPAARMALAKNSMADMACEESCGLNINPDDIRAEDTVTVVWSIA